MQLTLTNSTKVAWQATIAVILTLFLSHLLGFDRPYWSVIAAALLVSQTVGESLNKSFVRILMTVLGGVIGTALYFYLLPYPHLMFFVLCASLFFVGFYMDISYGLTVAFFTIIIVFLFAFLTTWTLDILWIRIYETLFGACIAVLCSAIIFPVKATTEMQKGIPHFLTTVAACMEKGRCALLDNAPLPKEYKKDLFLALTQLKQKLQDVRYEKLFPFQSNTNMQDVMLVIESIYSYCSNFLAVMEERICPQALALVHKELVQLTQTVAKNLQWATDYSQDHPTGHFVAIQDIRMELWNEAMTSIQAGETTNQDWLNLFSASYMLRHVNDCLPALVEALAS